MRPVGILLVIQLFACFTLNSEANIIAVNNDPSQYSDKVDLAIVYHLSQKIKPAEVKKYFVPFLVSVVEKASIDNGDVRVALVSFPRKARVIFNLAKFKTSAEVIKKINEIDPKERARRSSGGSALQEVRTRIFTAAGGDREGVPNAIILITDAKTSDDQDDFVREAAALSQRGVKIITVGVESADAKELQSVSSPPVEENAVFSKSYSSIAAQEIITSIYRAIPALQGAPVGVQVTARETVTGLVQY
ncbi:hypothetical protein BsWGS_18525 [Bradybaena similaris]